MVIAVFPPLYGCASLSPGQVAHRGALVGGWVPEGGECESDGGVVYRADGTFRAYDVSGTWSRNGSKLITQITERGEPDEPVAKVNPPERHVATIVSASAKRHVLRWEDGSLHSYVRC